MGDNANPLWAAGGGLWVAGWQPVLMGKCGQQGWGEGGGVEGWVLLSQFPPTICRELPSQGPTHNLYYEGALLFLGTVLYSTMLCPF